MLNHIVRILGAYSLFTFFHLKGQEKFFETVTSPDWESMLSFNTEYAGGSEGFRLDTDEKQFELEMTNMGFIREGVWKEAFPPIFSSIKQDSGLEFDWYTVLPPSTQETLKSSLRDSNNPKFAEAVLYRYALCKLGKELEKVREASGRLRVHIGLNKFGIANVGITIEFPQRKEAFENLCKRAYQKVAHLQEDPLTDFEEDLKQYGRGKSPTCLETCCSTANSFYERIEILDSIITHVRRRRDLPRLIVSYFQVLAITTIHRFLSEKQFIFEKKNQIHWHGFPQIMWLAEPWSLANELPDSSRKGLPPLRHVVFMYQLVHEFQEKSGFLRSADNRRALLTLGHNVGWAPSDNDPFPLFKHSSPDDLLTDASLLERSCCFVFPQGLVVVLPTEATVYPGGHAGTCPSPSLLYADYWRLIFKLLIRMTEARLLMSVVNRYLSDIHKDFLRYRQLGLVCRIWQGFLWFVGKGLISKIFSQLMHVGWILQRTSGRVITPEVTRYSFVRKKLTIFLEGVNFEGQRGYIQSEFEKLNHWIDHTISTLAARTALVVSIIAIVVSIGVGWWQINAGKQVGGSQGTQNEKGRSMPQ